jgi:SAM-dependent methyltransferase
MSKTDYATIVNDRVEYVSPPCDIVFPTEWYEANSEDHFWFQWRARAADALVARLGLPTGQPLRVFDIGCGTGIAARQLGRTTSWVFDGADLNLEALKRCSGGVERVLHYDVLEKREEFRERYDAAILFDVIEHVEHTRPFLDAVLFHLKPGATVLVNVPALMALFSVYDTVAGHYRRYNRKTLAAEFAPLGATVVDEVYWGFSLVPLLVLRKLVLRDGTNETETIRAGMVPPSRFAHSVLKGVMIAETTLLKRPLFGSSLMAAIRKNA